MRELWIGSTRTGKLIQQVDFTDYTNFSKTIHGDDRAEVITPLDKIPSQFKGNLGAFIKKNERFFAVIDDDLIENHVGFAGPIENFTPSNDKGVVSSYCVGMSLWLSRVPAIPLDKRARIDSQEATWTVTGTRSEIIAQVLTTATTETGNYRFPQCINPPTGGNPEVITHTFQLSELPTLKDFFDELAASYDGFEVVLVPRLITSPEKKVVWDTKIGDPHYRKGEAPIELNIDQRGNGGTAFSYTENGKEKANWWFARSGATDETNEDWIDLKSVVKTAPSDEEYLTLFAKEFFNGPQTDAELSSQLSARMAAGETELKTYTIATFDNDFNYVHSIGRRLHVTASKRLVGLDEMLRITGVTWNINDPSSVQLTVQPANLRVFPKVPNRLSDLVKDQTAKDAKEAKWKQPKAPKVDKPDPVVGDWEKPLGEQRKTDMTVVQSPITRTHALWNTNLNSMHGIGSEAPNQFAGPIWGTDKFGAMKDEGRGSMLTDSSTTIPNQSQQRFYGLSWSTQMIQAPDEGRDAPLPAEVFKTRKFVSYPTYTYSQSGNPEGPLTDAKWGFSGLGGLAGELSSAHISSQMMSEVGPGTLMFERLANGIFFRGAGETQKLVIYFHQLQVFDNGDGDNSQVRSKGFAFESLIDQETGNMTGSWTVTPYPFEIAGSDKTYYPETMQVESYGPEKSFVTCVTPAGYWRDNDMPVPYPFIVSNTYWERMQMGKYAIEDISITKNYRTGKIYQSNGPWINVFQTRSGTDERWVEKYQLLSYKGELWATNMTYSSYFTEVEKDGAHKFFRFVVKSQTDKEGKPVKFDVVSADYGYANGGYQGDWYAVFISPLVGLGDYVFSGSAGGEWELPEGYYSSVIAGKVGAMTGKVMYGVIPDEVSMTFQEANSASGATNSPKEFFPDFYDYSLNATPQKGGQKTWTKTTPGGAIIPIWNGTADNHLANESMHGISSRKALNIGDWLVVPCISNPYILGTSSSGYGGYWRWYGL